LLRDNYNECAAGKRLKPRVNDSKE